MRVLLVGTYYKPYVGGIEMHMEHLALGLQRLGVDVRVSCLHHDNQGDLETRHESLDGVRLRRIPTRGLGESLRWPIAPLVEDEVDLVHFHGFSRPLLIRTLRDNKRKPWMITLHGGIIGVPSDHKAVRRRAKSLFDASLGRRLLSGVSRVVCLDEGEAVSIREIAGISPSRVVVLPNFAPASDPLSCIPQGESGRLLVLARLARRKRIGDLINVVTRHPELPGCDIAGPEGDDSGKLKALARDAPDGRIRFLGTVVGLTKSRLIRAAKAVVLCSSWEGHSVTALEAIGQETPLISSDSAAVGLPQGALLTYPTGDLRALRDCIRSLDDPGASTLLLNSIQRARKSLISRDEYVRDLVSLYREIAE